MTFFMMMIQYISTSLCWTSRLLSVSNNIIANNNINRSHNNNIKYNNNTNNSNIPNKLSVSREQFTLNKPGWYMRVILKI